MALNDLKIGINNWIEAYITSLSLADPVAVFRLDQNGNKPNNTCIGYRFGNISQIDWDTVGPPDEVSGDAEVHGDREFVCMIRGFGTDSVQYLENLRSSLEYPTWIQYLRDRNIFVVNVEPVLDISVVNNTKYEEQGSLDILFRTDNTNMTIQPNTKDQVGVIEKMNGEGTLKNFPPLPDVVQDINVNP